MTEVALFGIAKSVLKQLASPAMDELKLLWNHNTQLENLKNTITTITMVLQDAEQQQANNRVVELWLDKLKAPLYDADDFFEIVSAKAMHHKVKYGSSRKGIKQVAGLPFSQMYHFAFMVRSAHKVKDITERIDVIAKDINNFSVLVKPIEQDQPERTQRETTYSYVRSNEVVGREQEREDIVKMLLSPHQEHEVSVIAVIGFGGLGKTTVAQLVYGDDRLQHVYGDDRLQDGFDLHIWACINYFSCLNQVLVTLVESVTKSKVEALATQNLQHELRKQITGKRFLLVLDDVWDEDPLNWRKLKILLDCGMPGSMVLATTRSVKVAQSLSAIEPYYRLQGMSDESAWILFKEIAFKGKHQQRHNPMEVLGQQIVKKCVSVPLLIVTIASFLRHQEESKWCSLVDGEFPKVVPGDYYTNVLQVLKISYREFPYPVKRCFAFCSLFPKHFNLEKDELIRLWIAEGFVEGDDVDQSLEDKAEEYLFYLVDRCFFHKRKWRDDQRVYFQMHDLVHDLGKEVAGSESISYVDINAKKRTVLPGSGKDTGKTVRHVSLHRGDWQSFPHSMRTIRTCLMFRYLVANHHLNKLMSNFEALRVLDLSSLRIKRIPSTVGKLTHLRFLNLSWNEMERLPSSICSLYHLQSLNLVGCNNLKELPEEIGRLISMRHLMLGYKWMLGYIGINYDIPKGLAALTSLVTLDTQVVHKHGGELRYFEKLDNLSGSLSILILETGWEDVIVDAQKASLSRKSRLKEIKIEFKEVESGVQVEVLMVALEPHHNLEQLTIKGFGGNKMPQWIMGLDRLVSLWLYDCSRVVELPPLSRILSLKELRLSEMSSLLSIEGDTSYDPETVFFPSLETLILKVLPDLRGWWVQEPEVLPRFPCVTNLSIQGCRKLEIACMPLFESIVEDLKLWVVQEEVMWGIGNKCSSALKSLAIGQIEGLSRFGGAEIRKFFGLTSLSVEDWWGHLSRLRHLEIQNVTMEDFERLKFLTSLEKLQISGFVGDGVEEEGRVTPWEFLHRLQTLDLSFGESFCTRGVLDGVEYLTNSLKDLTLSNCRDLYLPWTSLLSLRLLNILRFIDVEKVIHVVLAASRGIQQQLINTSPGRVLLIWGGSAEWVHDMPWMSFPSLSHLCLRHISNMEAVPQGIQHLSSLRVLTLRSLQRLTSLPSWISSLSSLDDLYLLDCSEELKKRCQEPTGEDWPLIQHIARVGIS